MAQSPLTTSADLDLDNIQGDILSGFPKITETFYFFQITNATVFRTQLARFIPLVTTVAKVLKDRKAIEDSQKKHPGQLVHLAEINISFSHKGFVKMNIDDSNLVTDASFGKGQKDGAGDLGDPMKSGIPDWEPSFLKDIHGVILIAGDSHKSVNDKLNCIKNIFGIGTSSASILEVKTVVGDVRPGDQAGHEHFGFLDGVSNPAVIGFDTNPPPGPKPSNPGVFLLGHPGDPNLPTRPKWVVDGSFLAFRYLSQTVPEFDSFLRKNALNVPGLLNGKELLGARMVGRWKSGAPIDLTPFADDPILANDINRRNNFSFAAEAAFPKICPFAAHIRKTNPRDDLPAPALDPHKIMRRGIAFGPEVTGQEKNSEQTQRDRGLLFACYQSSIDSGFKFIQRFWCNNPNFPPGAPRPPLPGLDPIIGQGDPIQMSCIDPNNPSTETTFPKFVIPRGGEYFFSPSLNALKGTLASP